jgi:hypothetical protein
MGVLGSKDETRGEQRKLDREEVYSSGFKREEIFTFS